MSVLNSNPFLIASGSPNDPAVPLQRSLRLRSSASAYLNRTTGTPTNANIWTWSAWVKRGTLSTRQILLCGGTNNVNYICFGDTVGTDNFGLVYANTPSQLVNVQTTATYRDPSAWYHLMVVYDSTSSIGTITGSGADRVRLYVNGIQINAFASTTPPAQNTSVNINTAASVLNIGRRNLTTPDNYFDGYMAEVYFIDGQALTPSSFGGYNAGTNVWEVRKYTGTYGTNGFYLPFTNNGAVENLGYDLANSSPELITNGMFVSNVSGWTVTPGTGGSPSITWQSAHTARIANINAFGATYYQAIPTVIGQTYYAQCYTSNISLGGATRNAQLLKGDNTNFSTNLVVLGSVPQSSGSGAIRNTFVATATTTYIGIQADVGGTSGSADFTAVSVTTGSYKNSWNPFNISLTSGVTYDSMLDVPTNTGSNNANFATLNPLANAGTLSAGNLTTTGGDRWSISTIGMSSGKWYAEVTVTTVGTESSVGIATRNWLSTPEQPVVGNLNSASWGYLSTDGKKYNNTNSAYGATYTSGDIIGIAFDADAGTLTFYKNNVSQGVAFTGLTNGPYFFAVEGRTSGTANNCSINFGQRPFTYTPPSGFKGLNTYNLPEPTIPRGDKYFKQYLYTGNGGGQQIGEIQKPASLFNLDRSLRFRASNSAYLSRTFGTPTNQNIWTYSGWFKLGQAMVLLSKSTGTFYEYIAIDSTGQFFWVIRNAGGTIAKQSYATSQKLKDPFNWYHICVRKTASLTVDCYVNNVSVALTTQTTGSPTDVINSSVAHNIGWEFDGTTNQYSDGYLADVYFIDGQALAPTSFGAFDGNNYWTPKAYTGTYGTNGFHLEFEDYSNNTATTIGKDTSGQGNNWTPTGISITAGPTYDSMTDVPTLTSETTSNFATMSPLIGTTNLSSGNLYLTGAGAYRGGYGNIPLPSSGKWYWEGLYVQANNNLGFGLAVIDTQTPLTPLTGTGAIGFNNIGQWWVESGSTTSTGNPGWTATTVVGMRYDASTGEFSYTSNGSTWTTIVTGTARFIGKAWVPAAWCFATNDQITLNFGQRPFQYTPPTGFKSLNSFNVAEVTGDVESPDLVRIKSRSATTPALWFNSVSGAGKYLTGNNSTAAEATDPNSLIQFNKNGLLIGNNANINTSAATYIADVWKAGDTIVTNTAGSITSQVRANPISGVSIVSYTGTGANATVGHGLGVAPKMIIIKPRTPTSTSDNWEVYHVSAGNGQFLTLNSTAAAVTASNRWNNTSPTSTVFSIGPVPSSSADDYIAYCFSEIAGFSKFDSYISNGSATDGPFVYTGFRPRWVMIKQRDATRSWIMYDTTRNTYNVVDKYFFMEGLNNNEQTAALLDINSNGFKLKNNNLNTNTTAGSVYIYMAFAENPFKYALAR